MESGLRLIWDDRKDCEGWFIRYTDPKTEQEIDATGHPSLSVPPHDASSGDLYDWIAAALLWEQRAISPLMILDAIRNRAK